MKQKTFIAIAIIFLIAQIIISFISSGQIITLNSQLIEKTDKINQLEQENQSLENQYTSISSLKHISTQYDLKNLVPIRQKLDLTK